MDPNALKWTKDDKTSPTHKPNMMRLGGSSSTNLDGNVSNLLNVRVNRYRDGQIATDFAKTPVSTTTSSASATGSHPTMITTAPLSPMIWSWTREHADRRREREADEGLHGRHGATHYIYGSHSVPFEVDRRLLRDSVREKMGEEVGGIEFLSAGVCVFLSWCFFFPPLMPIARHIS